MNYRDMPSLVEQIRGVSFKPEDVRDFLDESSITLLRANNIVDGSIELSDVIYVDRKRVSKNQILRYGDILICASSGSKHLVGKAAQFMLDGEFTFGAFCKVVRPKSVADGDYISLFFQSSFYRRAISSVATGANINNIRNEHIDSLKIKWPDIEARKAIEKRLQSIMTAINYRKCQLHALDCLIKARFIELFGDPISNPRKLKMLPIGDLATEVRYGTSKPATEGGKYPYLRMNNITSDGHLDLSDLKYIDVSDDEIEKYVVRKGDVLFNRTNSIELVGKTALFDFPEDMIIAGYIIRIRLKGILLPGVLSQFLNLEAIKAKLRGMAKGAVNQANINAQELQGLKIYVPDLEKQEQFVIFKEQVDKSKVVVQKALDKAQQLFDSLMQEYFG